MQISAPVQPGNSGRPVVDPNRRVVGIVVSRLNYDDTRQVTGTNRTTIYETRPTARPVLAHEVLTKRHRVLRI